jgi:hypothetical protein
MHFPPELLSYINQIFIKCRENEMEKVIHASNICPCKEDDCLKGWYNGKEKRCIKTSWYQYHCHGTNCHRIFDDYGGIICTFCDEPFCEDCEDPDDDCCQQCQKYQNPITSSEDSLESDDY